MLFLLSLKWLKYYTVYLILFSGDGKVDDSGSVLKGSGTATLSISGSGFGDQDNCQNHLELGYNGVTAKCVATTNGASSFDCGITQEDMLLPQRDHTLGVFVNNKGKAAFTKMDFNFFSAVSVVQSISGIEGSFGGNTKVYKD